MLVVNFKGKVPIFLQEKLASSGFGVDDGVHYALSYPSRITNCILQDIGLPSRTPGQISPIHAVELGIKYAMVGHLERRVDLHESMEIIRLKMQTAIDFGLTPIYCVGLGSVLEILDELDHTLNGLRLSIGSTIYIAYEHFESTRTGAARVSIEEAEGILNLIGSRLKVIAKKLKMNLPLIYGGAVGSALIRRFNPRLIDGFLVGDRYTDPAGLSELIGAYKEFKSGRSECLID